MSLIPKYVFRGKCKTTFTNDGVNRNVKIEGPCPFCNKEISVAVIASDFESFQKGNYASACFPYLSASDREFLISGICDDCWDKLFKEEQ